MAEAQSLRSRLDGELNQLRTNRYSWWQSWGEKAEYLLPRRYRWLVTPNQYARGLPLNGKIIDSTGTIAARTLASGMMSGITSPTRPWFKLRIAGFGADEVNPVNIWLAECEKRMMHVFQESNFYNAIATLYFDLVIFGTAPMLIYEDFDNVIQCFNPCAGEYYVGINSKLEPSDLWREFTNTTQQLVDEYGLENCSLQVRNAYEAKGGSLQLEWKVVQAIKPNDGTVPEKFKYMDVTYEFGSPTNGEGKDQFLRKRGYHEAPFICPRWDTTGNDAYGRSPADDAMGDVKQLQQETKRKAQAIDKLANPPMIADVELKNQPASTLPGGVTYVAKKDGVGFSPAYQNFRPPVAEMSADIKEVQERIRTIFFNDLFLMISQLQTVRTATEIDARREEKLVMLGPVLERFQTEGLDPIIDRVFAIMSRGGLLPPPPAGIQPGEAIEIQYVSMLAEAQRAANTTGIERFLSQVGNVAAVRPEVLDIIHWDRMMTRYGMVLGNDPSDLCTEEEIAAIRAERAKQQQQQQAMEQSMAAVQGAKTLSETDVGGGTNALSAILNGGQAA